MPAKKTARAKKVAAPIGRPTVMTPEIKALICERIASGESLREICRDEAMPHRITVHRAIATDDNFRNQYADAKMIQMDDMAEELLEIADDIGGDPQRDRLRVDSRKWLMARIAAKKYGDRIEQTVQGPNGGPVQTDTTYRYVVVDPKEGT